MKKEKANFYDENAESRFKITTGSDIGVRICGETLKTINYNNWYNNWY